MDTIKTKKTLNSSKSLALMMAIVLIVTSLMALPAQEVRAAGHQQYNGYICLRKGVHGRKW